MKPFSQILARLAVLVMLTMGCGHVFGLGADHPNGQPVPASKEWPKDLEKLVNATNRVHGFWVNSEDVFFYSGQAGAFSEFLRNYSLVGGIEKRRLILHSGVGEAKSPWQNIGQSCDWKLYFCPRGWHNLATRSKPDASVETRQKAAQETGYVVEVHFWTGGHIALDQVSIPKNVEVAWEP